MLKMLTGLAARVLRLGGTGEPEKGLPDAGLRGGAGKALAAIADSEMLDWLDRQSTWSGLVAFRWSTTGRGWRLMEVPTDYPGTLQEGVVTPPSRKVRKAISDAMLMSSPTDTQALDWLDEQTDSYTGLVIWRLSTRGLGWRLHETSREGAKATVRETISDAMRREAAVNARRGSAIKWLGRPDRGKGDPRVATPSRMYCITQDETDVFRCELMAQDGFEMWKEASLDAAVESVIKAADTVNHASIGRDNITVRLLDFANTPREKHTRAGRGHVADSVNAALCRKCGDLVISKHRHDFVTCDCGSIAVDGGCDYNRRVGNLDDIRDIPTKALFDRLSELPRGDRGSEWTTKRTTKMLFGRLLGDRGSE